MDLESARPRLRDGVSLHPYPEGGGLARDWSRGEYLELDPDEYFVACKLDGNHPLCEVNRELFGRTGEMHVSSLLHLLARMQSLGLIEPLATTTFAPDEEYVNPAAQLLNRVGEFNLSRRMRRPSTGLGRPAPWPPIVAAALVSLLLLGISSTDSTRTLLLGDSRILGLTLFLTAIGAALTLRSLAAVGLLRRFGARPWRSGLGLGFLIPHLWIDTRDAAVGGRQARLQLAAVRLGTALLLAGVANWTYSVHGGNAARIVRDAFVFVLFATSFPLLPGGDIREILGIFESPARKWARRRQRLHDHLMAAATRNPFKNEPVLMLVVLALPVWLHCAYSGLAALVQDNLVPLVNDVAASGLWVFQGGVLFMLGFAAFTVALAAAVPVFEVLRAATLLVPGWQRHLVSRRHAPVHEETWQALGDVALFAHLDPSALRELAERMQLETYEAGDRIFAQGDSGERFYGIHRGQVEILFRDDQGFNKSVAVLGVGDSFGEIALLEGKPRTASVRALGRTELYSIGREPFDAFIAHLGIEGAQVTEFLRLSQFLRGIKLFRNLGPAETVRMLRRATRRMVAPGELIVQEGDAGDDFFLIRRGTFVVTVGGREAARLKPGEYFGEIALLMRTRRTAHVRAAGEGELLVLGRDHFYDTVAANFQLGLGLEQVTRLRRSQSKALAAKT